MNKFFSSTPLYQTAGLFLIRIVVGAFMIYHGWELFDTVKMNEYKTWDVFKGSALGNSLPYIGKAAELVGGILLLIGLFTRVASLIVVGTMAYIPFFIGNGKVFTNDQHPFLFVLLGLVYFFVGGGKWSIDNFLFNKTTKIK